MDLTPRLVRPLNWLPPPEWRTRFAAIDEDFAGQGLLWEEFQAVVRAAGNAGATPDLVAEAQIQALVGRHRDLFPGEAGERLAWSIFCGTPPQVSWVERDEDGSERERRPFDDPLPHYTAPFSRGRSLRYAARERASERSRRILDLLRREYSHIEVGRKIGMNPRVLHRELRRLRQQLGVRLRTQRLPPGGGSGISEQEFIARFRQAVISIKQRREQASAPSKRSKIKIDPRETKTPIPVAEVLARTGIDPEQLRASGIESYTSSTRGDDTRTEMMMIPIRLLTSADGGSGNDVETT